VFHCGGPSSVNNFIALRVGHSRCTRRWFPRNQSKCTAGLLRGALKGFNTRRRRRVSFSLSRHEFSPDDEYGMQIVARSNDCNRFAIEFVSTRYFFHLALSYEISMYGIRIRIFIKLRRAERRGNKRRAVNYRYRSGRTRVFARDATVRLRSRINVQFISRET